MTDKTPDQNATPIGLESFLLLSLRRRLTAIVKESLWHILADRGELWSVRGLRERDVPERALCTEADFDRALGLFLDRVPGVAGALADYQAIHDQRARDQARVDDAIRCREDSERKRS